MRITIGGIIAAVLVLFGIMVASGSFYTVDETQRGVLLRNGKAVATVQPGWDFKLPFVDSVVKIPVRTFTYEYKGMDSYSYDQQPATLKVSVTVHAVPENVGKLYAQYGSLENVVSQRLSPVVYERTKIVFGQYTAQRAIQSRNQLNSDISDAIAKQFNDETLKVVRVQVEDITFSAVYLKSIEERMISEIEVGRIKQNAEREKVTAEITVIKAKAAADAIVANAEAHAKAVILAGDAEASAIQAKAKALAQNQNLVELVRAEKWNGVLPTTMIPGSAIPMIGNLGSPK